MKNKNSLLKSFRCAFSGFSGAVKAERNLRIHLTAAAYVLYFSSFYKLSRAELAVLLVTIGLVVFSELVNTAVESAVDLASPDLHPLAKKAKDTAAGAVLVCAVLAGGVGFVLFWDTERFAYIFRYFTDRLPNALLLLASFCLAWLFIAHKTSKPNQ